MPTTRESATHPHLFITIAVGELEPAMVVLGGGAGRARCARLDIAARAALGSQVRAEVVRHPVDLEVVVFYELDANERVINALFSRPLQHLI